MFRGTMIKRAGSQRAVAETEGSASSVIGSSARSHTLIQRRSTSPSQSSLMGDNHRTYQFGAVQEALSKMSRLPEGHPYRVEADAANRARDLLGIVMSHMKVSAPQLFPFEGDSVVLKWIDGDVERYLSVEADSLEIMKKVVGLTTITELDADLAHNLAELFSAVADSPSAVSSATGADA